MDSMFLRRIFSLVTLIQATIAEEVTFTGKEFAGIYMKSILWDERRNFLQLRFRTLHENGVLVFSRGNFNKKNYFLLELIKGSLRFTSRLGGNHVTNISLGSDLADGKWHSVKVKPTRRQTEITLDSYPKTELAGEGYNIHSLDGTVFVGSKGKRETRNRFCGCLADVDFDGSKILIEAFRKRFPHITYTGDFIKRCVYDNYGSSLITFPSPNWVVKITVPKHFPGLNNLSISFEFRTRMKDGLFIKGAALNHRILLRLESGSLCFEITFSNGHSKLLKVGRNLHDGKWHAVYAGIHPTYLSLVVDHRSRAKKVNFKMKNVGKFFNQLRSNLFAGKGFQNKHQGFVGCLFNLTINNRKFSKKDFLKASGKLRVGVCSIKNKCYPNPCKNGGMCEQSYQSYRCNCSATEFEGKSCENTIYKQTCTEYRDLGLKHNSHCKLKGKDSNVFTAFCNVTDKARTYTVIAHMEMGKKSVRDDVTNSIGYLTHEIEYPLGMDQIEALVHSSQQCRQFIRYDCLRSILIGPPKRRAHMFWLSRDGKTQNHWGGADPDSHMCACGKRNNCSNPYVYCNCDMNDNVWRSDEGFFTSKELLPVTTLQFSKDGYQSYFTLGPLECWGTEQKTGAVSRKDLLSRACNPIPTPTPIPTTKRPSTTAKSTSASPCDTVAKTSGHCSFTNQTNLTTTEKQSVHYLFYPRVVATTDFRGNSKLVASLYEKRKNKNSSLEEFSLSLTAIVLISCVLVVFLLIIFRYQFPSVVVCARRLNRRGEATFSMVPPRDQIG